MVTFDAVIDLGQGEIGTLAISAADSEDAWAKARAMFPGCRLALVARESDEGFQGATGTLSTSEAPYESRL